MYNIIYSSEFDSVAEGCREIPDGSSKLHNKSVVMFKLTTLVQPVSTHIIQEENSSKVVPIPRIK